MMFGYKIVHVTLTAATTEKVWGIGRNVSIIQMNFDYSGALIDMFNTVIEYNN